MSAQARNQRLLTAVGVVTVAVGAVALAVIAAAGKAEELLERTGLKSRPQGAHPGEKRVYAPSEFGSQVDD